MIGGSWRQYSLNSDGTIFTDPVDGTIDYNEFGAYAQLVKRFADDRLKFTGSVRYDEADNFDGNFSPRISLSYSLGEGKTRNLRASYQTGFRNPTTQDLFIGLDAGQAHLVGSAPDNLDRYTTPSLPISPTGQALGFGSSVALSGRLAYENAFSLTSVQAGTPTKTSFDYVQPEKVSAYEIGYRAGFGSFSLDGSLYINVYEDFIGNKTVLVPLYGQADFSDFHPVLQLPNALIALGNGDFEPFQVYTNSEADVTSYGGSLGITTKIFNDYNFGFNYTLAKFDFDQKTDPDYEAGFNTPEHKLKLSFGNPALFENFGFNLNARWNDKYLWESTFADAIIDAKWVVDLQVNYSVPQWNSTFKVGGTNIGGKEYMSAPGVGRLGSQFFLTWTLNI
jgi:hypothetical protein